VTNLVIVTQRDHYAPISDRIADEVVQARAEFKIQEADE